MTAKRNARTRKATWLAFGLIALAAVAGATLEQPAEPETTTGLATGAASTSESQTILQGKPEAEIDTEAEAARAYKQALSTLATLTSLPSSQPSNAPISSWPSTTPHSNSLLSVILNAQGQGPFSSAIRIGIKLFQKVWPPKILMARNERKEYRARRRDEEMTRKAIKVVDLLQHAADLGNMDALYTLGRITLFPPSPNFRANPALAYDAFDSHAASTGNATAQALVAFMHATGYHDVVPIDQAKAQLYYTFAAHGGDKGAQMTLGYRYWSGIGAIEDCGRALEWYEQAAEQTMAKFMSGPPGGRTLPLTPTRLSDMDGGVYGPGASVASTGMNGQRPAIRAFRAHAAGETWEDILEYYIFQADRGETDFAFRLGKIFYHGSIYAAQGGAASGGEGVARIPRDFERAYYYFSRIARQIWPTDPVDPLSHRSPAREEGAGPVGYAAAAAGYLGRMYLRGEGLRQDAGRARMWFERGAEYADKESHNGLGIIWRDGLVDGKRDMKRAVGYFGVAAGQELAEAQVNMGKYHLQRKEIKLATTYFETALRHGSPFEAYYYLAQIQAQQLKMLPQAMRTGSCSVAVSFYKVVAERGAWDDDLLTAGEDAWRLETNAGRELAMLRWWIAAERGIEMAQNNLAYVLDQDKSVLRNTRFKTFSPSNDTARLALTQWTRSAAQNNVDALVKVGDYYYHGLGVPDEPEEVRYEKAVGYYQSAAGTQVSALAMWNLGWMYENGLGVPQDFHLAKRHYDLAMETNSEAYLPVLLSLVKLHLRSIWHTAMGGEGGLSLFEYEDEYDESAGTQETRGELDEGKRSEEDTRTGGGAAVEEQQAPVHDDDDNSPWYYGKARDEFNRRRGIDVPPDDEDPVQWARDRRNAEADRDSDFGPEDYFEGALRGGYRHEGDEEEMDDFWETTVLVGALMGVAILLYVRARNVERLREEERRRAEQQGGNNAQGEGGLFPPVGDPARDDWAILR